MEVVMCYFQNDVLFVLKEAKDINVIKVFEMIANKKEGKTMTNHISCDCKWKFHSATCNSNQEWNNETCQCACKNSRICKKDYKAAMETNFTLKKEWYRIRPKK